MSTFTKTDWFLSLRESPFLIGRQAWIGLRMIRTKTVRVDSVQRALSARLNCSRWTASAASSVLCRKERISISG